jgi:hypothetical protein
VDEKTEVEVRMLDLAVVDADKEAMAEAAEAVVMGGLMIPLPLIFHPLSGMQ